MMTEEIAIMPSVKIRIEKGVDTAGDGQEQQENKLSKAEKKKIALAAFLAKQAINVTKQIINFSTSHIGEWTGDYIKQANTQASLEYLETGAGLITAGAMSVATENPIPIIMEVLSLGLKTGFSHYEDARKQAKARHDYEFLQQRTGNSTTNGSRGTEY